MRPHEFEEVIGKLRTLKLPEIPASSSDQPAAQAAADPVVMVPSSVSEPAAAPCEVIVQQMDSEISMDVQKTEQYNSTEAIWARISCEKKPLSREHVSDPQYCSRDVVPYNPRDEQPKDRNGKPCSHYEATTPKYVDLK